MVKKPTKFSPMKDGANMERTLATGRGGSSRNSSPSNSPRTVRGRTAHTSSPLVVRGGGGTRGDRGGGRAGGRNDIDSAGPGAASPGKQADAVGNAVAITAAAADADAKSQAVAAKAGAEAARLQATANALAVTAATPSPLDTLMRMLDENKRNDAAAGATSPVFKSRARTVAEAARLQATANALAVTAATPSPLDTLMRMLDENKRTDAAAGATSPVFKSRARTGAGA
eukprot:gene23631-4471_t